MITVCSSFFMDAEWKKIFAIAYMKVGHVSESIVAQHLPSLL